MAISPWVCRRCTLRLLAVRSLNGTTLPANAERIERRRQTRSYQTEPSSRATVEWDDWFCSAAPYTPSSSNATAHDREHKSYHARARKGWAPSVRLQSSFAPQIQLQPPNSHTKGAVTRQAPGAVLVSHEKKDFQDELWVRENLNFPSQEDYPWAPNELFDAVSARALRDAFELVRPRQLALHHQTRLVRHGQLKLWRDELTASFRESNSRDAIRRGPIRVVGESPHRDSALKSSLLQVIAALHTEGLLRQPATSKTSQWSERVPLDRIQDWNVKLEVYNFAAHFGVIPEFNVSASSGDGEAAWQITVAVKTPSGLELYGTASAPFLQDAEYNACADFKKSAIESKIPQVVDVQDLRYTNLDNAKTILSIYRSKYPTSKLEKKVQTSYLPDGILVWSAQYILEGNPLGHPVTMVAKEKAQRLADLVAAVTVTQRLPHLLADYEVRKAHARGLRISRDEPIEASGIDSISTSFEAVAESFQRSAGQLNETPSDLTRKVTQSAGARVLLGHFQQRIDNHENRMSREARSENLRVLQDYYKFNPLLDDIKAQRLALPIAESRNEIISTIASNPYTIVVGSTGSGKSTQIPQMILEEAIERQDGANCNIVCTQPRRVAVQALARRVAAERDEALGEVTGFQISGDYVVAELGGSITYSTPELQALQLELDEGLVMDGVSHFIIDEAHQRDRHTDRLISLLKQAVQKRSAAGRRAPKIILMSATLHTDTFQAYFQDVLPEAQSAVPVVSVPGRLYPVNETYLDEILDEVLGRTFSDVELSRFLDDEETQVFLDQETALATSTNSQDKQNKTHPASPSIQWQSRQENSTNTVGFSPSLIAAAVGHALQSSPTGDVLVFLPGYGAIEKTRKALNLHADVVFRGIPNYSIDMLHSVVAEAVEEALSSTSPGQRRVFLATNIAETSVTFPNVNHVIDTGRRRDRIRHPLFGVDILNECWISKASATQRAGRAGRVRPGFYYALYSAERLRTFEPTQTWFSATPIDLMRPALRALRAQLTPDRYFRMSINQPDASSVNAALLELRNMGALTSHNMLTDLGELLALIPLTPPSAVLVLLGLMFRCLEPLLVLATAANENPLFLRGWDEHSSRRAQTMRLYYSRGTYSDHISLVNAYREVRQVREDQGDEKAEQWAKNSFIDYRRFLTIDRQVQSMPALLRMLGILKEPFEAYNARADDNDLITALSTAAMYPNVAIHTAKTSFATPIGLPGLPSKYSNVYLQHSAFTSASTKPKPLSSDVVCYSLYQYIDYEGVSMQNISKTSPLALALFGAQEIKIDNDASGLLILDDWLTVKVKDNTVAEAVLRLKATWKSAFERFVREHVKGRSAGLQGFRNRKARDSFVQNVVDLLHLERGDIGDSDTIAEALAGLDILGTSRSPDAFDAVEGLLSPDDQPVSEQLQASWALQDSGNEDESEGGARHGELKESDRHWPPLPQDAEPEFGHLPHEA